MDGEYETPTSRTLNPCRQPKDHLHKVLLVIKRANYSIFLKGPDVESDDIASFQTLVS